MLSRTGRIAVNIAFFAALLLPAVATLLSPGFVPFIKDALSGDRSTKVGVELLRRATPLWKGGTDFYNRILYDLGVSANPAQLMMGKDGYMFLGDANYMAYEQDLRRYDLPDAALDKWIDDLAYEEKYVSDRGGRMFLIVAPSKGSIYPDKLKGLPRGFGGLESIFDRAQKRAEKRGLSIIDVRPDLIQARKTAETYSRFNSHWTDYGGYVAWQKIASTIEKAVPSLKLTGIDDLDHVGVRDFGNEASSLLSLEEPNPWTYPIRKEKFPIYYIVAGDGTQKSIPGDVRTEFLILPVETYSPEAPNPQRLLVITDSMGAALSPYWTASFQHVKQVVNQVRSPRDPFHFEATIDGYKPDIVFYVMAERYLALPLRSNGKGY